MGLTCWPLVRLFQEALYRMTLRRAGRLFRPEIENFVVGPVPLFGQREKAAVAMFGVDAVPSRRDGQPFGLTQFEEAEQVADPGVERRRTGEARCDKAIGCLHGRQHGHARIDRIDFGAIEQW